MKYEIGAFESHSIHRTFNTNQFKNRFFLLDLIEIRLDRFRHAAIDTIWHKRHFQIWIPTKTEFNMRNRTQFNCRTRLRNYDLDAYQMQATRISIAVV